MWKTFEKSNERVSTSLKRVEEEIKTFAANPINMEDNTKISENVQKFTADLDALENVIFEIDKLGTAIATVSPQVKVSHYSINLKQRHSAAKRGLDTLSAKLQSLNECQAEQLSSIEKYVFTINYMFKN